MGFRLSLVPLALLLAQISSVSADPGAPDFGPALYGDGELWGTKATTALPAPNAHNAGSFDKVFVFVNGAPGQLPVSEAAPGNPTYNGGRWSAQTVMWTDAGMDALPTLPVLKSYADIQFHHSLGHLAIASASVYFQCPLLPVH